MVSSVHALRDEEVKWFFTATDIWGCTRGEEFGGLRPPFDVTEQGRALAYVTRLQLRSRIATQRLNFRAGVAEAAATSIYQLFPFARTKTEQHGPEAAPVADIVWWMLNRDVRPFTARWHRVAERGQLQNEEVSRRFRGELEHLASCLTAWSALLSRLCVDPAALIELPDKRNPRAAVPSGGAMAVLPPKSDSMPVPTAYPNDFAELMTRETKLINEWRAYLKEAGVERVGLSGLALSGGGIRSATFSLGVLTALASRFDVFGVDYISTVSGGGYLGGLIDSAFERGLFNEDSPARGPLGSESGYGEAVVAWLRGNSANMSLTPLPGAAEQTPAHDAGVARIYRERLLSTWIVERDEEEKKGFPAQVLDSGEDIALQDLEKPSPLHLWNLALNATNLDRRMQIALRGRGADLYTVSRAGTESRLLGYSELGEHWRLSTAMALSGAAIAATTSETQGGLGAQTFGNAADLGAHVDDLNGKLKQGTWWERTKLLFGQSDASHESAYLSDGGHVENTGVYSLLRRRCAFILAIDGEHDSKMTFAGLVELQHLARVELRTKLDIDTSELELVDGYSGSHFTIIQVHYPKTEHAPAQRGVIVYVKLSLTGDEPRYLRAFREQEPDFPHHTTMKQSYDDKFFEAYLALGEHVGAQLVSEPLTGGLSGSGFEAWAGQLAEKFGEM